MGQLDFDQLEQAGTASHSVSSLKIWESKSSSYVTIYL